MVQSSVELAQVDPWLAKTLREAQVHKHRLEIALARVNAMIAAMTVENGFTPVAVSSVLDLPPEQPQEPPAATDAVLALMAEDPQRLWQVTELRDELVLRGLLGDSKAAYHNLQNACWRLEKRGKIVRPERGRYGLPPAQPALSEPSSGKVTGEGPG